MRSHHTMTQYVDIHSHIYIYIYNIYIYIYMGIGTLWRLWFIGVTPSFPAEKPVVLVCGQEAAFIHQDPGDAAVVLGCDSGRREGLSVEKRHKPQMGLFVRGPPAPKLVGFSLVSL